MGKMLAAALLAIAPMTATAATALDPFGVNDIAADDYFFAFAPGAFNSGFTLDFVNSSTETRSVSTELDISASEIDNDASAFFTVGADVFTFNLGLPDVVGFASLAVLDAKLNFSVGAGQAFTFTLNPGGPGLQIKDLSMRLDVDSTGTPTSVIPLPAAAPLLGAAVLGLALYRRRKSA